MITDEDIAKVRKRTNVNPDDLSTYKPEIYKLIVQNMHIRHGNTSVSLEGNEKLIGFLFQPTTMTDQDLKDIMSDPNIERRMAFYKLYETTYGQGSGITALKGNLLAEHTDKRWGRTWEVDLDAKINGVPVCIYYLEVVNPTLERGQLTPRTFFLQIPRELATSPKVANLWTYGIVDNNGKFSKAALEDYPVLKDMKPEEFEFTNRA